MLGRGEGVFTEFARPGMGTGRFGRDDDTGGDRGLLSGEGAGLGGIGTSL